MTFPKIELHVHLEGTVRARTLLQLARRNGMALPADTVEGLRHGPVYLVSTDDPEAAHWPAPELATESG